MKKSYIIAVFVVILGVFGIFYVNNVSEVTNPQIENPDSNIDEVIVDVSNPLDDVDVVEEPVIAMITENTQISQYIDENDIVLVNSSVILPKAEGESEFAINFNLYYDKISVKVEDYKNYEGSDLAEHELEEYKDEFRPINYYMSYNVMYEDENIISIKREVNMYSNETDFFEILTETFSQKDGALVLITDICPNILEKSEEYFGISISSFEDFKFCITSEGVWCKTEEFETILPYNQIDLDETYIYLGEKDDTD